MMTVMINALSPETLVQILDALPVRIFWKDRESRFLGCNKCFADDAGIADPAEFIGKSDFYFYHPDQARGFRDDDADVMFKGEPKLGIIERVVDGEGREMWLQTSKLPLRDANGVVVGVIGMYHDITSSQTSKQLEAA